MATALALEPLFSYSCSPISPVLSIFSPLECLLGVFLLWLRISGYQGPTFFIHIFRRCTGLPFLLPFMLAQSHTGLPFALIFFLPLSDSRTERTTKKK
ncbi:hypothetical protein F5H01DRAFT_331587 [Linnemannia elongata]|nr:hypothetical protein F5H01DRAFT_331587 [Linnemannia elongata]